MKGDVGREGVRGSRTPGLTPHPPRLDHPEARRALPPRTRGRGSTGPGSGRGRFAHPVDRYRRVTYRRCYGGPGWLHSLRCRSARSARRLRRCSIGCRPDVSRTARACHARPVKGRHPAWTTPAPPPGSPAVSPPAARTPCPPPPPASPPRPNPTTHPAESRRQRCRPRGCRRTVRSARRAAPHDHPRRYARPRSGCRRTWSPPRRVDRPRRQRPGGRARERSQAGARSPAG